MRAAPASDPAAGKRVGSLDPGRRTRRQMKSPDTALLRIANPADLVRASAADTVNFGFLQSTNTQCSSVCSRSYT